MSSPQWNSVYLGELLKKHTFFVFLIALFLGFMLLFTLVVVVVIVAVAAALSWCWW